MNADVLGVQKVEHIVITGFATMETAKQSFNRGGFDFLAKPFKLDKFLAVIRKAEIKKKEMIPA